MDDPRYAIWGVLHDGTVTVVVREDPDVLIMFVSIPFVRRRISPLGDSFRLRLGGVRSFGVSEYESDSDRKEREKAGFPLTSLSELRDIEGLEIIEVLSTTMPVKIRTFWGPIWLTLQIDFDSLDIALDSGHPISYEEVRRAAQDYWDELEGRTRPLQ